MMLNVGVDLHKRVSPIAVFQLRRLAEIAYHIWKDESDSFAVLRRIGVPGRARLLAWPTGR